MFDSAAREPLLYLAEALALVGREQEARGELEHGSGLAKWFAMMQTRGRA